MRPFCAVDVVGVSTSKTTVTNRVAPVIFVVVIVGGVGVGGGVSSNEGS